MELVAFQSSNSFFFFLLLAPKGDDSDETIQDYHAPLFVNHNAPISPVEFRGVVSFFSHLGNHGPPCLGTAIIYHMIEYELRKTLNIERIWKDRR